MPRLTSSTSHTHIGIRKQRKELTCHTLSFAAMSCKKFSMIYGTYVLSPHTCTTHAAHMFVCFVNRMSVNGCNNDDHLDGRSLEGEHKGAEKKTIFPPSNCQKRRHLSVKHIAFHSVLLDLVDCRGCEPHARYARMNVHGISSTPPTLVTNSGFDALRYY